MTLGRYTKKPVTIDAFQWPLEQHRWPQWFIDAIDQGYANVETHPKSHVILRHDRGSIDGAREGDWIIRGVEGELYPCSDSVFQATYVCAEEDQQEMRPGPVGKEMW